MRHWWTISWIAVSLVMLGDVVAHAKVPHLVRYQGTLVDKAEVPLDGPYTLTFRLYEAEAGGTALWAETHKDVPIAKGTFSVFLGSVTTLNLAFDRDLWLSIQVDTDPEMAPRIQLGSVPTAFRAETAEQLSGKLPESSITFDPAAGHRHDGTDSRKIEGVPPGAILLWTGTSCPAGYTRFAGLDGKFLVAGSSYNAAAGGSNTHSHSGASVSGTTSNESNNTYLSVEGGYPNDRIAGGDGSAPVRRWSHTHTFSGTTGSTGTADSRPEFATVLLCQKN